MENDDIIELNVDGQTINGNEKINILSSRGLALLALMFGGRWKGNMMRDKDGRFFLDSNKKFWFYTGLSLCT
jgi:hypothetical protein